MNLYRNNLTIGDIPQLDVAAPSFFPKTGLVAYYKLDEASGNASDSVGSNTLTNTNVTFSAGKINNGGVFVGSNNSRLATSSMSGSGTSWSYSLWIKPSASYADAGGRVLMHYASGSSELSLVCDRSSNKYFVYNWNGSSFPFVYSTTTINTSAFTHLVVINNAGAITFYFNGVVDNTGTTNNVNLSTNFNIGRDQLNNRNPFDGQIDEVGIWSRALTSDEITKLYNNGNGLTY